MQSKSNPSATNRFSPAVLERYGALQRSLYSAIDDVLIRYWGDCWYIFCPTIRQTLLATLVLADPQSPPRVMDAISPENGRSYVGFQVSNHYILYRPETQDTTARVRPVEVRELLAQQIQTLSRFFD